MTRDLLRVRRVRFDYQIVDPRGHFVAVLLRQQHGEGRLFNHPQDAVGRRELFRQHHARQLPARLGRRGGGRPDDVLPVAGSDDERAALEMVHGRGRAHRADDHAFDQVVAAAVTVERTCARSSWMAANVGLDRIWRWGSTPSNSSPLRLNPRRANSVM